MIPVLDLTGTPREMGRRHGEAARDAILRFAEERVALAGDEGWSGRAADRAEVLELAEACWRAHVAYDAELAEELEGMAEATGLSPAELVVVGGFTDVIDAVYATRPGRAAPAPAGADNCTAVLVPGARAEGGRALFAQTWDMHESGSDHVLMLRGRPSRGPAFDCFSSAGCVGMIGMNEHGVVVGINNLMARDGAVGVTWPFVVRSALRERDLEGALARVLEAPLAGAHNYLLLDAEGRGANVEATPTERHVDRLDGAVLAHTNHCLAPGTRGLERAREEDSQRDSEARLERAGELLGEGPVDVERLMALTRDPAAICKPGAPPRHVATCGAVVARPATRELWAVRGLPSEGEYRRFALD